MGRRKIDSRQFIEDERLRQVSIFIFMLFLDYFLQTQARGPQENHGDVHALRGQGTTHHRGRHTEEDNIVQV